jgi:hypothetical protein
MKGRQKGRPTKWVRASVEQWIDVNRTGIKFDITRKWKRRSKKLGTLIVSVGGLRWLPAKGKATRWQDWNRVKDWLTDA